MDDLNFTIGGTAADAVSALSAKTETSAVQEKREQPSIYGMIPQTPTQEAVNGIRFDFCDGLRVLFPPDADREYRCCFRDLDSDLILYSMDVPPGALVTSNSKFFVRFGLEIYEKGGNEPLFRHDLDLTGREVMVQLPVGTLGDSIAWFSYVERFQQKHNCRIVCVMTQWIAEVFRKQYPDITFIGKEDTGKYRPYACYHLGLFFGGNTTHQPVDFRYIGLHRTAGMILGLEGGDLADIPPRVDLSAPRKIREKYVCIAVQASSHAKKWNNPSGWLEVVKHLKDNGYRVLCIDRETVHGSGLAWTQIPNGAEDFTGNLPLQERIDLIKDADMFIGLSSGLSWLAWCCHVPVIMISGFTEPENEFYTPYRIISRHFCHGCWNDMRCDFDHFDYLWCPRHKGTDRQFECTRSITSKQVIDKIGMIALKPKAKGDE